MKRFLTVSFLVSLAMIVLHSCQKEYSLETDSNKAVFSIHNDSTLSCNTIAVNGTYYNGVPVKPDTNYIRVVVNVKSTGSYTIASSQQNGFIFKDSGFFSKIGIDTITMRASGTPILITTTDFTISTDTLGACNFFVNVQDSTGTGLGGDSTGVGTEPQEDTSYVDPNPATDSSWHITDSASGTEYQGVMGKSGNSFIDSSGTYILTIAGYTTDLSKVFGFKFYLPNSNLTTGVYPIEGENTLGLADVTNNSVVYVSNEILLDNAISYSYVKITTYDPTTKHIEGSIHTWAVDATGSLKLLKGSFNTYLP